MIWTAKDSLSTYPDYEIDNGVGGTMIARIGDDLSAHPAFAMWHPCRRHVDAHVTLIKNVEQAITLLCMCWQKIMSCGKLSESPR